MKVVFKMEMLALTVVCVIICASCGKEPSGERSGSVIPHLDQVVLDEEKVDMALRSVPDSVKEVPILSEKENIPIMIEPPPPPFDGPTYEGYMHVYDDMDVIVVQELDDTIVPMNPDIPAPVMLQDPNGEIDLFPMVQAQFPGGNSKFYEYIQNQIIYPEVDREMGIEGKVFVSFIIELDGSITNIKILRGISKSLDREAKRVVRGMPKWTPGLNEKGPVRTIFNVPITFKLS